MICFRRCVTQDSQDDQPLSSNFPVGVGDRCWFNMQKTHSAPLVLLYNNYQSASSQSLIAYLDVDRAQRFSLDTRHTKTLGNVVALAPEDFADGNLTIA